MKNVSEWAIEPFLEMMLVERGAAQHTLDAYKRDLREHCEFLCRQNKNLVTACEQDLQNWHENLAMTGIQASSMARKISAVRQIYKFMFAEELREDNPAQRLGSPKLPRALPKILSQEDIRRLFCAIVQLHSKNPDEGIRMSCLLEILYATGLRVSELVSLPLSAIGAQRGIVHVCGKGEKERVIPLSTGALSALTAYMQIRVKFLPPSQTGKYDKGYAFPSKSREGHLTRQRFGQMLKKLGETAGIAPEKISPHVIRHAFASHMLNNGAKLLSVQKMLGHADITTTQIYTHILDENLKDFVLENHPLTAIIAAETS